MKRRAFLQTLGLWPLGLQTLGLMAGARVASAQSGDAAGPAARPAAATAITGPEPDWRLLTYRTRAEIAANHFYGDPEQFLQGLVRAPSDPMRIYGGQDVGPFLRSDDGGASWQVCVARGLKNAYFTAAAVDPVNRDVVMTLCHNRASTTAALQAGLWRSEDGGVTFTRALATGPQGEPKIVAQSIAYAPSSVDARGARRWYTAFPDREAKSGTPADSGFWQSDDRGQNWTRVLDAMPEATYGRTIYELRVAPDNAERIWMGTDIGLFFSQDAGATWTPVGGLPEGGCSHIETDPANADRLFVSIIGQGGYYTDDGFASATELFTDPRLRRAFPHPADWNICCRVPNRGTSQGRFDQAEISADLLAALTTPGTSPGWTRAQVPEKPGNNAAWWREISTEPSYVLWHPTDTSAALAVSKGHFFRTENRVNWDFSNQGHAGFNYGNSAINTEFIFDHFDSARIVMPHADIGILITTNRFDSYEQASGYRNLALDTRSTKTTCNVCALQPLPGSRNIVAAVGDYNASTMVSSSDGGQTWALVGPALAGDRVRCWSIHYALSEPEYCYAHRWQSRDGGQTFTELMGLTAVGRDMLIIGASRSPVSGSIPALYAVDHRGPRAYRDLWKSVDRGVTWKKALACRAGDRLHGAGDSQPVFRVDPINPHVIYTIAPASLRGAVAGSLSRYDTSTGDWTHYDIWSAITRENANGVRHIATDPLWAANHPEAPPILYVRLQHGGMRNVLRSLDGGASWQNMTYDGMNAVGQGFEVHPLTGELYIGGEAGTRMLAPPYDSEGRVSAMPWALPDNIALTP